MITKIALAVTWLFIFLTWRVLWRLDRQRKELSEKLKQLEEMSSLGETNK